MSGKIALVEAGGRKTITTQALVYCNTKYHKPYLAVVGPDGEFDWQDKEYSGYGKHRITYYVIENLKPGDLIQAAGGSGGNKCPFKGRVIEIGDDYMEVEELSDREFSNLIAKLKNGNQLEALRAKEEQLTKALEEVRGKIAQIQEED